MTDAQSSVDQISGFLPHCIELRVRPVIMLWLAAASEQVNLVILVDNLEVLLWRPWRVVCGVWHELKLVPRTSSPAGPTTSSPSSSVK